MVAKLISVDKLLLNPENPRYDPKSNQLNALRALAGDQEEKLFNLAQDIAERGLNPAELPIVTPLDGSGEYLVLEGNRRIAALKLLRSPSLLTGLGLSTTLIEKFNELVTNSSTTSPTSVMCAILSHEEANHWMQIRHTGENKGVGVVPWNGVQTQRFRGNSPTLQIFDLVKDSDYLDDETRKKLANFSISNLERIVNTPEAREHLGVDIEKGHLRFKVAEEQAIARMATVVSDIAHKRITVSNIDTKPQRIDYAKQAGSQPMGKQLAPKTKLGGGGQKTTPANTTPQSKRKNPTDRKKLIPSGVKLIISQARINRIYNELQKLVIDQFPNSGAVLFRVFLELSIDEYADQKGVSLKKARTSGQNFEMTLREKLTAVADFMQKQKICTKDELRRIRTLVKNRDHVLSIDSLHAYVHSKNFNPSSNELKLIWDDTQVFFEKLWA